MSRTILYYPEIQIPTSGPWIRKSLLYWDKLGAIVPQSYDDQMDAKMLKRYSPEIECLYKDGIFKPFNPEMVFWNPATRESLRKEFKETLYPETRPKKRTRANTNRCDVPIYRDKVASDVFKELEQDGLAVKSFEDPALYLFEKRTVDVYMALLAKHLALASPEPTVPGADSAAETNLMFGQTKTREPENLVVSAKFNELIPTPNPDTPLRKILRFRKKHHEALLSFWAAIDGFEKELKACKDPAEIKTITQAQKERIAAETANLASALRANSIGSWLGSLEAFIKPSSPAILGAGYAVASKATSLASVPVELIALGAVGAGAIGVGMHWFSKVQERKALKRSSFAYLPLAKRKLG